jgi:hypothetical protein
VSLCIEGEKWAWHGGESAGNTKIIWIPVVGRRSTWAFVSFMYVECVKFLGVQQETEGASQYLCIYIGGRDNE